MSSGRRAARTSSFRSRRGIIAVGATIVLLGAMVLGAWLLSRDTAQPAAAPGEIGGPLNPLTPDEQTREAGRLLYQANCAVCHGESGKGDGPAALSLNPRPGDLAQHMVVGKHTDGQLFVWIHDGIPGTAMPAWGQRFSDDEIWQLVTYLRGFGQQAASSQAGPVATVAPASDQSSSGTAVTVAPTSDQPTALSQAREPLPPLIFVRQGNLWRSDGSASPPRPITNLERGSYAQYPALAPDGRQVALISTSQAPITETTPLPLPIPTTHLYLMNADGSELRLLWAPERGVLSAPAWSPDGRALYVSLADILSAPGAPVTERLFQVLRVDPTTGAREVALSDAREPAFAPDGSAMAYLRWHQNVAAFSLNIAAPDGSGERELTRRDLFPELYAPRFSPDGRQIIFISAGGPPTDEQGYPITGSQSPLDRVMAFFAPAVAEAHGTKLDLWVINADGSGLRRLAALREDTPMAVFSPNGGQIAVMGAGGIYLLNADGTNLRLIDPLGDHGGLAWAR